MHNMGHKWKASSGTLRPRLEYQRVTRNEDKNERSKWRTAGRTSEERDGRRKRQPRPRGGGGRASHARFSASVLGRLFCQYMRIYAVCVNYSLHMPPFSLGFLVLAVTCTYVSAIFVSLLSSFMVLYFTANRWEAESHTLCRLYTYDKRTSLLASCQLKMQEKQKVCGGGSCHRQPRFSFSLASGFSVLLPVYAYMLYATLFIHSVFSLNFPRSSCPGLYVPCQLCLLAFLLLLHSIFTPIKRRKREEDPPLVMQAVYVMTSELS